jgi:hypothetical protein
MTRGTDWQVRMVSIVADPKALNDDMILVPGGD